MLCCLRKSSHIFAVVAVHVLLTGPALAQNAPGTLGCCLVRTQPGVCKTSFEQDSAGNIHVKSGCVGAVAAVKPTSGLMCVVEWDTACSGSSINSSQCHGNEDDGKPCIFATTTFQNVGCEKVAACGGRYIIPGFYPSDN